ncbi:hypothetical protein DAEQUDRAFT_731862 [Daedalea quercina L-15889]|uniref:Uncharacterized protein n=1 Tax=Daedalea quercina L-15889 TaxID=1314783 RepID=A0A165LYH8_9APHY|nr:hypothetical protein DAEQUDRAFT_731862 [Daedalea quercina L-15889]
MTWVYGWPLYHRDAIKIAKKHNLVKRPDADDYDYIEAAQLWVGRNAGSPRALCCWVGEDTNLVFAAYVDYRERAHPPQKVFIDEMMSEKQARRLARCMPLRDQGWYRYCDGSWVPWLGELWEETDMNPEDRLTSDDDSEDEETDGDSDDIDEGDEDDVDEGSDEGSGEDSNEGHDEDTDRDDATVTDGRVHPLNVAPEECATPVSSKSLATDFGTHCTIAEPRPRLRAM